MGVLDFGFCFRSKGGVLLGYALRALVPFRVNPTYDRSLRYPTSP